MTEYEDQARARGNVDLPEGSLIDFGRDAERSKLVAEYSWAIPNEEALQLITSYGPIIEIGAGNGYWAWELEKRGCDIVAFDPEPYVQGQYAVFGERWEKTDYGKVLKLVDEGQRIYRRKWADVEKGDHTVVTDERYRDRNLFICWPGWGEPWATEAVESCYCETLILIGELGGCTGDEDLAGALSRNFKLTKTVDIPRFLMLHDLLTVWQR